MSRVEKKFTLSHTIDISSVTYQRKQTEIETHFSIPWCMVYFKSVNSRFTFGVSCLNTKSEKWEIDTKLEFKLKYSNSITLQLTDERTFEKSKLSWAWSELAKLKEIEQNAENGTFLVEAHVTIRKMSGFGPEKLRYFDESSQNHWDAILSVDGHKFYMSRAFLAFQSTYFDKLLFGSFKEADQKEVELKEVDHEDFHNFLELIHGESAVNDTNINGVLHLSDMFDVPTAVRRCEEFLLEKSKWSIDEKMKIAERYHLKDLMKNLQQSSKEEKKGKVGDDVCLPVKKPLKSSWFSCIRKQRD